MWRVGGNCCIIIVCACRATVSCSSWIKRWLMLRNKLFHSSPPAASLLRLWLMTRSQIESVRRNKGRFQAEIRARRVNEKSGLHHPAPCFIVCTCSNVYQKRLKLIIPYELVDTSLSICCLCKLCRKCFFVINIRIKQKTNCSHICYFCMCLPVCLWWVDGWLRRAGRRSASGQHVAPLWTATDTDGGDGVTHLDTALQGHIDWGCLLNKASK